MPSHRARPGRATIAAALFLLAALRARSVAASEDARALPGGDVTGASEAGEVGAVGRAAPESSGGKEQAVGEAVEIPVARDEVAPASASTTVDVARFALEQGSVAELLAASPGTTVRALGGPLQSATLSLRGASADESLVLLDGIPLHGPGGGAFDLAQIPAQLISQLVVHRGVLGAQLGAGALGGALEIVPRGAGEEAHGGASASFGSFGTAQLSLDGSAGRSESGGLLSGATLGLQLERTAGDFTYLRNFTPDLPGAPLVPETRENDGVQRIGLLAREERSLGNGMTLDLILLGSLDALGVPGPEGNPTPAVRSDDQGGLAGARLRMLAGPAVVTARAWVQGDRVVLSGLGDGFSLCAIGSTDPSCLPQENHSVAARGAGEAAFPLGGSNWAAVSFEGGADWFAGAGAGVHRRFAGALSLRDDLTLLGGALLVHPALRFDAVGSDLAASPALGISARPFSGALQPLELRASGGSSFRAPTFSELYLAQGATAPNPDLQPERAGSIDAGASWKTERITIAASIFWSRYRDLILYELYPPERQKAFNIGEARVQGAELEALLLLPLGFTAEAAYSYLDAIDERPAATELGQQLPYRPPHRLFTRLARRGDRLEGFAQLGFSSAMPRNQFGTTALASQLTIDCGAGARLLGPLWLDLEVKNLLDDQTEQDLFQYPLPGLSLTAIARARF